MKLKKYLILAGLLTSIYGFANTVSSFDFIDLVVNKALPSQQTLIWHTEENTQVLAMQLTRVTTAGQCTVSCSPANNCQDLQTAAKQYPAYAKLWANLNDCKGPLWGFAATVNDTVPVNATMLVVRANANLKPQSDNMSPTMMFNAPRASK